VGPVRAWPLHTRLGEHAIASELYQAALEIFLDTGARNGLGDATRASGRPADAVVHHTTALRVAIGSDYPYGQATAHGGLGSDHQALGDSDLAARHLKKVTGGTIR
jgi:Tetratricopeptide repeat